MDISDIKRILFFIIEIIIKIKLQYIYIYIFLFIRVVSIALFKCLAIKVSTMLQKYANVYNKRFIFI